MWEKQVSVAYYDEEIERLYRASDCDPISVYIVLTCNLFALYGNDWQYHSSSQWLETHRTMWLEFLRLSDN